MTNRTTEQSRFKVPEGMIIERDVDIPMDDGLVLKADVYRPDTRGPVPVIMTMGPYGKGVMYQDHYKPMWEWLVGKHPDILGGSARSFLTWETVDPHTPLAQGWLRASHLKLDPARSKPWQPYHTHDDKQPLKPGEVYDVDVEIWPTCIILPKGFRLAVVIAGKDFQRPGPDQIPVFPSRGSGPWLHDDPRDRPAEIFGGTTTVHTGPGREAYLLLPVIPPR